MERIVLFLATNRPSCLYAHSSPLPDKMAAFGIAGGGGGGLKRLFITYPPLEERIAALKVLQES